MIPHLSKLININNLDDFEQFFSFFKTTFFFIIPKNYNQLNPYYNTYNNNYQFIIYCSYINKDQRYKLFLENFMSESDIQNVSNNNIALFEIEDGNLNFVDIKKNHFDFNSNFSLNLTSTQNLILEDINVKGIYYNVPYNMIIPEDVRVLNFKNVFTINVRNTETLNEYNTKYNKYYMFPDSQNSTETSYNENYIYPYNFEFPNYTFSYLTRNTKYSNKAYIAYSENEFVTKNRIKQYSVEYFDHIIPNVNNEKQIGIAYRTIPTSTYLNLDIYNEGTLSEYKLDNVTSLQWISNNTFQIVKDYVLYECNFNQETCSFYNLIELENLNTYSNGLIKFNENIIKIGSVILSEKQNYSDSLGTRYSYKQYINNKEYGTGYSPFGSNNVYFLYTYDYAFGIDMLQPSVYQFDNFIIIPRKRAIFPININDTSQKKTISVGNDYSYIANRQENSIVKIENTQNIQLLENDATLISESGNNSFYKMKTNLSFKEIGSNVSLAKIYNNINDINGAFKNINHDTTNNILLKVEPYDYDTTYSTISFELNIHPNEINSLLKDNKFIKLTNENNNYYLTQNGYVFNSLSELKNNLYNILEENFSNDIINIQNIDTSNSNYIEDVIGIQNTIDKEIFAIVNNFEQIKLGYNSIKYNKYFKTYTNKLSGTSEFKIEKFISSDGTVYDTTDINFSLYNISIDNMFKIVFNVERKWLNNSRNNAILNVEYIIDTMESCENSYLKNVNYITPNEYTIDTTISNITNDTTSLILSVIDETALTFSENINFSNLIIRNDEKLNIDIYTSDFNLDKNINNIDIFSSYKYNDFIDIKISDRYYNTNILHYDFIGKTFNTYKINLSTENKFYTFGNLPKKCKSWISTWYDYIDSSINEFYGNYSEGFFYNLIEQNSSKFFINRFKSLNNFSIPSIDNNPCNAYYITQYDSEDQSLLSSSQSIDIQPTDKESHTLFVNAPVNNLISSGNTKYTSYEQRYYIAHYGNNYCALLNGISSINWILGTSVKPVNYYTNNNYLFNIDNCYGCNLYNNYDSSVSSNNLCFTLNKYSDSTSYIESLYIDGNKMINSVYNNRINEYITNGYPIKKNYDFGIPNLADGKNKSKVIYFTNVNISESGQVSGGNTQNHIIDFDYELSQSEIEFLSNNLNEILSKNFSEKRKMGKEVANNKFTYKFIESSSYIYNIPRSLINIQIEKKFNTVYLYVNGTLFNEIYTNDSFINIEGILNYGNLQSCNKTIKIYKTENIVLKNSGIWC